MFGRLVSNPVVVALSCRIGPSPVALRNARAPTGFLSMGPPSRGGAQAAPLEKD
jgi:hypothetical protein